ncbi:DUF2147 domain-containing protein [Pseudosulfitobacter sp. DSM 107133]|uniref:DUF2147 domain-containing protein n=1 Tax=Pseudosulfitobacter sp. DSM 107133 TaxID=2883100 RepID=UPI000DF3D835|nr:DUF2147 domain-containing protein [Pseudosulfitobacter sp. DSM 107133]UOA27746.1 hypothetical protein DSM107133_02481 [Pseudosulfitobacter sp. DSM 107133]
MKRFIIAAAIGVVMAGAAMAEPVLGTWKTQVDDGAYAYVEFTPCGASLCATIAKTFNDTGEYKSPNLGKKLVWDMKADGGGNYSGGTIWQPSTGKEYRSKMVLSGNTLKVSGCVGPFCKKQTWSRVK